MYQSKYYTCEEIDERLLRGYYDDAVTNGYAGTIDQMKASLASENYIDLTVVYPGQDFNFTTAVEKISSLVTNPKRGFRFSYIDTEYMDGVYLTFECTGDTPSDKSWKCVGDLRVSTDFVDTIPTSIDMAKTIAVGRLPSRWTLINPQNTGYGITVGVIGVFSDAGLHQLTEVLTTNYKLNQGVLDWTVHDDTQLYTYYRQYNVSSSYGESAKGTWTAWREYIPETIATTYLKLNGSNSMKGDLYMNKHSINEVTEVREGRSTQGLYMSFHTPSGYEIAFGHAENDGAEGDFEDIDYGGFKTDGYFYAEGFATLSQNTQGLLVNDGTVLSVMTTDEVTAMVNEVFS